MAPADVEGVARLEQESPSPWSLAQIAAELAWSGSVALIAENSEGGLCGWCCARYLGEEAELLKIAVRTESRRMGAGSALLVSLQKELGLHGVREIFLEVRRQNESALRLYQKHDFEVVGSRRGYYSNPTDDALICQFHFSCGAQP